MVQGLMFQPVYSGLHQGMKEKTTQKRKNNPYGIFLLLVWIQGVGLGLCPGQRS